MTEIKHMSETQDINELAQALVTVDKEIRSTGYVPEGCVKSALCDAYSKDGSYLGRERIYEHERLSLGGIDVSEQGHLLVVMKSDDPDEFAPAKFTLSVQEMEDSFPAHFDQLDHMVSLITPSNSLGNLAWNTRKRILGKPALTQVVRNHLKEGRRAFLEGQAEAEELAAEAFYKTTSDYGIF